MRPAARIDQIGPVDREIGEIRELGKPRRQRLLEIAQAGETDQADRHFRETPDEGEAKLQRRDPEVAAALMNPREG